MGLYDPLKATLKDAYLRRGIRRVVYFHCDHWEPWRSVPGADAISEANRDEVQRFVDTCSRLDFAARQTLFYKCPINSIFDHDPYVRRGVKADPRDGIRFTSRTERQMDVVREAMRHVVVRSEMDVQVHIHHENVTYNTAHDDQAVIDFIGSPGARHYEEQRLSLLVDLALRSIEEETGRKLDRWFFVHGHWGLNASDPGVCHLTREIAILMDHGCLGDFTIPSGRSVVNPRLEVPYFITPVDAPKGYDRQEGEPELAYGNRTARERGKFLIWSSVIKHRGASLDYHAPWLQERLEDLGGLAHEMVAQSYAVEGTLYIKTHAHSMHPNYYVNTDKAVFPHLHPPVQTLFGVLFDAAAAAGCKVDFLTVSELYDEFTTADFVPPGGAALVMPGHAPVIDDCVAAERRLVLKTYIVSPPGTPLGPRSDIDFLPLIGAAAAHAPSVDEPLLPPPTDPLAHIPLIGDIAKIAVQDLIDVLGETESGAGHVYAARAAAPTFLTHYELELIQYLAAAEPYESYYEIGCGFGAMIVALASAGMASVGIESDKRRAAGAQRVLDRTVHAFAERRFRLAAACEIVQGRFPAPLKGRDVTRALAYCTDLTSTHTPEQRADLIAGLRCHKTVIVDLQRFVERRSTPAACAQLLAELQESGLGEGREVLNLGSGGLYVRFDPT